MPCPAQLYVKQRQKNPFFLMDMLACAPNLSIEPQKNVEVMMVIIVFFQLSYY